MFQLSRSTLAGIPRATLQTWLAQAQGALAALASGQKVVSVSYAQGDGNKSVTYNQQSMSDLNNWILLLNQALGVSNGARRPMRPFFG